MIKRAATAILVTVGLAVAVAGCSTTEPGDRPLVMGASDMPAMQVMAQIYAGALRHAGSAVSSDTRAGDYRTLLDDMDATSVDLFPAFSGRLLSQLAPQLAPATADETYTDLNRSLPQGVSIGDPTMVVATPQVIVAASVAEQRKVTELADCAQMSSGLPVVVVGAPDAATIEAFTATGCRFGPVESVPTTAAAIERIAGGRAVGILTPLDVAGDDAEGAADEIRALQAPAPAADSAAAPAASGSGAQSGPAEQSGSATTGIVVAGPRAQQLVPVYRTAALSRDEMQTVNKVAGELTTADLATLAGRAATGADTRELADGWLAEHGL
ncbi:glycine betaine ABC transporter substrate-binding protein [Gordonia insulae]|uniref:glycine betaine ABC transporter substrate-binding protein n=1 Tax=Gordonia insulae TaxID=2420509 RepID=UPI0022B25F26|nr:glycine betaine ABC transporter substrate-binding protein [Gordonia insulae]